MAPKITLYTSYACPWAHRSQIALKELNLSFETQIIDLKVPRTASYLAINPRGLVPALVYNNEVLTESAIVSQFLVDAHPSHLEKTSSEEGGPLQRARINFFVDTYFSKVNGLSYPALKAEGEEKKEKARGIVEAIVKEIEPLLRDAGPYFGGSERLTLAEVSFSFPQFVF
jgi:glutathione S-transferase